MKRKTIIIDGWEYETETNDFNKKLSDIEVPEGWELWDYADCIKLHNDKKLRKELNLEDCWFYIKQPFDFNENKYTARFVAGSDGADLYCYGVPWGTYSALGVRFKRKIKELK